MHIETKFILRKKYKLYKDLKGCKSLFKARHTCNKEINRQIRGKQEKFIRRGCITKAGIA